MTLSPYCSILPKKPSNRLAAKSQGARVEISDRPVGEVVTIPYQGRIPRCPGSLAAFGFLFSITVLSDKLVFKNLLGSHVRSSLSASSAALFRRVRFGDRNRSLGGLRGIAQDAQTQLRRPVGFGLTVVPYQIHRRVMGLCIGKRGGSSSADSSGWKSHPDIQRTLAFWYGGEYLNKETTHKDSKEYLETRQNIWWGGDKSVDEKARAYRDLILAVGEGCEPGDPKAWDTPEGYLARIILLDQLSRNAFRGQPEAFKYDKKGVELVKEGHEKGYFRNFSFSELQFATMPLMHSENIKDHDLLLSIWSDSRKRLGEEMKAFVDFTEQFAVSHRKVIEKFGRYPHRNKLYKRVSTPEEEAWLMSDDVPAWAKSQG
ncbi:hypothetical protein AAMO2058_000802100 [Amorphochlora amoebiformis]